MNCRPALGSGVAGSSAALAVDLCPDIPGRVAECGGSGPRRWRRPRGADRAKRCCWPPTAGSRRSGRAAAGPSGRASPGYCRSALGARRGVAGARIGAPDMSADRAGKAVWVGVEHEAVAAAVGGSTPGRSSPVSKSRQGRAVHAPADHRLGERCRRSAPTRSASAPTQRQKPRTSWASSRNTRYEPLRPRSRARAAVERSAERRSARRRELRRVGGEAVFVGIAEQDLAEREFVGEGTVGLRAGRAGASQSKLGCDTPSAKPNGSMSPMSVVTRASMTANPLASACSRVVAFERGHAVPDGRTA